MIFPSEHVVAGDLDTSLDKMMDEFGEPDQPNFKPVNFSPVMRQLVKKCEKLFDKDDLATGRLVILKSRRGG